MPRPTTTDRALADVEKAIKTHDKALDKVRAAQEKLAESARVASRADRELQWYARHPDLPDDFDLDEFRRSLEEPFDDEDDRDKGKDRDDVDPVAPDEDELDAIAEGQADVAAGRVAELNDAGDEDDPWAGEA